MIQVSEMEKGIIYATKACISFGGEESFAQGPLLKKKQKEDKEAKLMLRNSMALYHRDVKKDEREAEKKRFQDTGRAVFSFFLRKFSANPDPWMDEYTKMLPQPDGSIGKEYGGVGGVGFVYELGEEVLKEKFRGTSAEFSSVYTFARAYATVLFLFLLPLDFPDLNSFFFFSGDSKILRHGKNHQGCLRAPKSNSRAVRSVHHFPMRISDVPRARLDSFYRLRERNYVRTCCQHGKSLLQNQFQGRGCGSGWLRSVLLPLCCLDERFFFYQKLTGNLARIEGHETCQERRGAHHRLRLYFQ